jgi:hypothetical protein
MPVLSAGAHPGGPTTGACVMEYISFLAGEKWTDFPSCTNRVLAKAAQYANDNLGDDERQRLLPLLPRLMNTSQASIEINLALAEEAASAVLPLVGHKTPFVHTCAEDAQLGIHAQHPYPESVIGAAFIAASGAGMDQVELLSILIDAYDKATGRDETPVVTEDDFRRLAELTGATA